MRKNYPSKNVKKLKKTFFFHLHIIRMCKVAGQYLFNFGSGSTFPPISASIRIRHQPYMSILYLEIKFKKL